MARLRYLREIRNEKRSVDIEQLISDGDAEDEMQNLNAMALGRLRDVPHEQINAIEQKLDIVRSYRIRLLKEPNIDLTRFSFLFASPELVN